jgi:hypothetical protein
VDHMQRHALAVNVTGLEYEIYLRLFKNRHCF